MNKEAAATMTANDHVVEAELLLERAAQAPNGDIADRLIHRAHVHALLAVAASEVGVPEVTALLDRVER